MAGTPSPYARYSFSLSLYLPSTSRYRRPTPPSRSSRSSSSLLTSRCFPRKIFYWRYLFSFSEAVVFPLDTNIVFRLEPFLYNDRRRAIIATFSLTCFCILFIYIFHSKKKKKNLVFYTYYLYIFTSRRKKLRKQKEKKESKSSFRTAANVGFKIVILLFFRHLLVIFSAALNT